MDRAQRMKSEENNFKNKETSKQGTSGKNKKCGGNCGDSSNYVLKYTE